MTVLPPDEENPRRWFVGVSADRPMEIQFTEANGPGGWVQADEHDRAVARAFAAGRAAATPDPPRVVPRSELRRVAAQSGECPICFNATPAASLDERLREAQAIIGKIPREQLGRIMRDLAAADREAPDPSVSPDQEETRDD